jgi:hypothetical protein
MGRLRLAPDMVRSQVRSLPREPAGLMDARLPRPNRNAPAVDCIGAGPIVAAILGLLVAWQTPHP